MNIVDGHCHIASTRYVPKQFFRGIAKNMQAGLSSRGQSIPLEQTVRMISAQQSDHQGDGLIKEMDESGISKTVLLLPDFTYEFESDLQYSEMVAEHFSILERHVDRFYLFYCVDPRKPKAFDEFEKLVQKYGLDGLKLYPPCGYSPSDKRLYPFYDLCEQYRKPVLLHTGPTSPALKFNFGDPSLIDEAARKFEGVNFILAHGAVNNTESAALLCKYRSNLYMDTGGFIGSMSHDGWSSHLSRLFKQGINHKIIFGTDWPVFRNSGGLRQNVVDFLNVESGPMKELSAFDQNLIMGDNILRLLSDG